MTILFQKIKEKYSSEDLDDYIYDLKAAEATDINNRGMDAQLEYLHKKYNVGWLIKTFLTRHRS